MAAAEAAESHRDSEIWPDTYNERYIDQFQPESTHKIH